MTPDKKNELVKELTDGMYDRQMLLDALTNIKDVMTKMYLEQIRNADEQKEMACAYDELRALSGFLK